MGGGGGSSGKVGYADYLEDAHDMMITGGVTTLTFDYDLMMIMENMMTLNPYLYQSAYNPDTALTTMSSAVTAFATFADTLTNETSLALEATAYDEEVTTILESDTIPKYDALMRDIGAVQSSSFAVGKALIYAEKTRNVDAHLAKSRMTWKNVYVQAKQAVMETEIGIEKTRIVSKHDEEQRDSEIDKLARTWQLDTLIRGGQFLGILGGGSMIPEGASKAQSAVAGGLGGAAAGAGIGFMMGGPVGAGIGGAAGLALGAGASFL